MNVRGSIDCEVGRPLAGTREFAAPSASKGLFSNVATSVSEWRFVHSLTLVATKQQDLSSEVENTPKLAACLPVVPAISR